MAICGWELNYVNIKLFVFIFASENVWLCDFGVVVWSSALPNLIPWAGEVTMHDWHKSFRRHI